jgi:hypothetical protein
VARALWPTARYTGPQLADGRERDGLFETDEVVHIVEATTSRQRDKIAQDLSKTARLIRSRQNQESTRAVRGWIITKDDPTAEQAEVAKPYTKQISLLSFRGFKARLIDSHRYIEDRKNYYFGSIRNPDPKVNEDFPDDRYIPLDALDELTGAACSVDELVSNVLYKSTRYVILGDYGAGKSMTLRRIFFRLADAYRSKTHARFPVHINLRDHLGQDHTSEVLDRHSSSLACRFHGRYLGRF